MSRHLRRGSVAIPIFVVLLALLGPAGAAFATPHAGEAWVARYNGPGSDEDEGNAVATSPDGSRVFVTGHSYGSSSGNDYATVAYSAATGAPLWLQRYNGPGNGTDEATSVAVSADGTRVFVTGNSFGTTTSYDYATIAYDAATGSPLWSKRYNGLGNVDDYGTSVGVSPDGTRVFVTGYSYGGTINYDYATVAYDASTGSELWNRRFDGTDHSADEADSLVVDPSGSRIYVTGYADMGGSGNDYVTQAYDAATGTPIWGKSYNGTGNNSDYALSIAIAPNGSRLFVTGRSYGVSTGYDFATIAINPATGASLWLRRYNNPAGNGSDYGESVTVSPDSSKVYVTGYTLGGSTSYDYATFGYSAATGAIIWAKGYNGPGNGSDYAFSVGVTPDGQYVYVTGYAASGASGNDYATLAYLGSNGALVGVRRYNGPSNGSDYANALAVSAEKVFVTGESYGGSSKGYDYATAAYNI
jgi:dienelactone hydrolase